MNGVTKVWSLESGGELWLFETSDLEVRTNFYIFSHKLVPYQRKKIPPLSSNKSSGISRFTQDK